jgi:AraC-like DNA-binding protein
VHSSSVRPHGSHTLRHRLERTADLYLRDCYERKTAARSDEYARHLELTRQYLARRASDVLGMPLRDFLRVRQLRHAEHLLRTTSYSTVEIAAMSAFGTYPTFYRAFKAAYGMTPGAYRKQVPK